MSRFVHEQLERDLFIVVRIAVRIEEFGNHALQLLDECLETAGFGRQPWDIVARRDPDLRFVIPICSNHKRSLHVRSLAALRERR